MELIKHTNGYKVVVKEIKEDENGNLTIKISKTDFEISNKLSEKKRREIHSKHSIENPDSVITVDPCFARLTLDCKVSKIENIEPWHDRSRTASEEDSEEVEVAEEISE